jgi:hypothetical protein
VRVFLLVLCVASSAYAQPQSGVAAVVVKVQDSRNNPYSGADPLAGRRHDASQKFMQTYGPSEGLLKRAKIEVKICNNANGCVVKSGYTNSSGQFIENWSGINGSFLRIKIWASRQVVDTTDILPSRSVAIGSSIASTIVLYEGETPVNSIPANGIASLIITLPASEAVNAYLTAEEMVTTVLFEQFGGANAVFPDDAASIKSFTHRSFQDLDIVLNSTAIAPQDGGIAPTDESIFLWPTKGNGATIAHEMGHIIMWRLHDDDIAPVNPNLDYMCDGLPSWAPGTLECERAAFMDGFADFTLALYKWQRDATGARQKGYDLAVPSAFCPPHVPGTPNTNHRQARCNTRGFWRMYSTRTFGKILQAMDAYPFCVNLFNDNHCENERWMIGFGAPGLLTADPNAQNWKDFCYNWETSVGTSTDSVSVWAGLKDGEL